MTTPIVAAPPAGARMPATAGGGCGADAERADEFADAVKAVAGEFADARKAVAGEAAEGAAQPGTAAGHSGAPGLRTAPGLLRLAAAATGSVAELDTGRAAVMVADFDPCVALAGEAAAAAADGVYVQMNDGIQSEDANAVADAPAPLITPPVTPPAVSPAVPDADAAAAGTDDGGQLAAAAAAAADGPLTEPGDETDAESDDAASHAAGHGAVSKQGRSEGAARGVAATAVPPAVGFTLSAGPSHGAPVPGRDNAASTSRVEAHAAAGSLSDGGLVVVPGTATGAAPSVEGAAPASPAPGTPAGTAAQLAGAVFNVARRGIDGTRQLTVDITPEELGPVRLTVTMRAGEVHVLLGGSSELSREALRQALPELRKVLEAAGVATGEFDVHPEQPDARPDWAGSAGGSGRNGNASGDSGTSGGAHRSARPGGADDSGGSGSRRAAALSADHSLDLHL